MGRSRRRKKMTSILPDSLDVIEECSEEMESSVTSMDYDPNSPAKPRARKMVISSSVNRDDFEDDPSEGSYYTDDEEDDDEEEGNNNEDNTRSRSIELSPVQQQLDAVPENDSDGEEDGRKAEQQAIKDDKSDDTAGTASTSSSNGEGGGGGPRSSTPPPPPEVPSGQHASTAMIEPPLSPRKQLYDYDKDYVAPRGGSSRQKEKELSPQLPPAPIMEGTTSSSSNNINNNNNNNNINASNSTGTNSTSDDDTPSWRLPPAESKSDWTIKVKNRDDAGGAVETFHVHKNMLASGKRRSEYFVQAFSKNGSKRNLTEISLYGAAVKVMPLLLDFMYNKSPRIKPENAVGLRFLAQFFGIKVLFKKVMDFIQKDLSLATMSSYVKDSTNLKDEKLLGIAARHCARNILKIEKSHKLLHYLEPSFVLRIMMAPGIVSDERRRHLSILVVSSCKMHRDRVDGPLFQKLTSDVALPVIHKDAALPLLDLEADMVMPTSLQSFSSMSNLQERCIRDLAVHWKDLSAADPKETTRVCRKLPSFIVTELLVQSLAKAAASSQRSDSDSARRSRSNPRGESSSPPDRNALLKGGSLRMPKKSEPLPDRGIGTKSKSLRIGGHGDPAAPSRGLHKSSSLKMRSGGDKSEKTPDRSLSKGGSMRIRASSSSSSGSAPLDRGLSKATSLKMSSSSRKRSFEERLLDMKADHRDELAKLKREYESNLLKLRDLCVEKDKHISNYWDEIQKFERLPNHPDGKLVTSGLMHGQASKLPEIGRHAKDGYLLVPKKSGGAKYPVFYYKCDTS